MQLNSNVTDDAIIITVHSKRIVAAGAIQFKDQMRELTSGDSNRVILDLQEVEFIDSSGLGAIIASMKQLAVGKVLELSSLTPNVKKVFHLTRMHTVFKIHEDRAAALGNQQEAG